jgi:hypothetical protein
MERSKYRSFLRGLFDCRFSVDEFFENADYKLSYLKDRLQRAYLIRVLEFIDDEIERTEIAEEEMPVFNKSFLNYVLRNVEPEEREQVQEVRAA